MKSTVKKLLCLICLFGLMLTASCGQKPASGLNGEKPTFVEPKYDGSRTKDQVGFQLELPEKGEEIAVVKTSEGTLKVRLFPDSAPIGVTNFKLLVEDGYYDGLTFHRIQSEFVAQGGDPDGDGTGGESFWGRDFETETNANLLHLKGALAYANRGIDTNGSQFYFVTTTNPTPMEMSYCFDADARALYSQYGGSPYLDYAGLYTVFGQVFDGMDVLDKINACGSATGAPAKAVTIISITLEEY